MAKQANSKPQRSGAKGQVRDGHRIGDGVINLGSYQPTKYVTSPPPSKTTKSSK
jgi:hypothetical protein